MPLRWPHVHGRSWAGAPRLDPAGLAAVRSERDAVHAELRAARADPDERPDGLQRLQLPRSLWLE